MKKDNIYSILIKNDFKIPLTEYFLDNIMWYRGYTFGFIKYKLNNDDKKALQNILPSYTDQQWINLFIRLKNNGYVCEGTIYQ